MNYLICNIIIRVYNLLFVCGINITTPMRCFNEKNNKCLICPARIIPNQFI